MPGSNNKFTAIQMFAMTKPAIHMDKATTTASVTFPSLPEDDWSPLAEAMIFYTIYGHICIDRKTIFQYAAVSRNLENGYQQQ